MNEHLMLNQCKRIAQDVVMYRHMVLNARSRGFTGAYSGNKVPTIEDAQPELVS